MRYFVVRHTNRSGSGEDSNDGTSGKLGDSNAGANNELYVDQSYLEPS
jgi:hypothetical protein